MRRISYLFLALCFCLPVIGCGGDAATETSTPAAEDSGEAAEDSSEAGSGAAEEGAGGSEAKEEAPASE